MPPNQPALNCLMEWCAMNRSDQYDQINSKSLKLASLPDSGIGVHRGWTQHQEHWEWRVSIRSVLEHTLDRHKILDDRISLYAGRLHGSLQIFVAMTFLQTVRGVPLPRLSAEGKRRN